MTDVNNYNQILEDIYISMDTCTNALGQIWLTHFMTCSIRDIPHIKGFKIIS